MTFPVYTRKERLADSLIHGVGVTASLVAAAALMVAVALTGERLALVSAAVYAAGLIATLGLSAAYNLTTRPEWKEAIRRYDHAAIFLMIAGTYTPFALVAIGGPFGLALLATVWLLAGAGMAFKLLRPRRLERASVLLYLGLGWLGLPALGALVAALPMEVLLLLGIGGLLYSLGVGFHLWERLPHQNGLWHALVLAAAACHYVAVFAVLTGS